jgi:hypothetical protein
MGMGSMSLAGAGGATVVIDHVVDVRGNIDEDLLNKLRHDKFYAEKVTTEITNQMKSSMLSRGGK